MYFAHMWHVLNKCSNATPPSLHTYGDTRDVYAYKKPSTSCTGTVSLVLGLGLGFDIILYFMIGTWSNGL